MAEGPLESANQPRKAYLWTEIFRSFQVALDPRKLLVAAAGILVMSLGWYLLSVIFDVPQPPDRNDDTKYGAKGGETSLGSGAKKWSAADKKYVDFSVDDYKAEGERLYQQDLEQWKVLHNLAGQNGQLRTMPWKEYRGPNPFLLMQDLTSGSSVDRSNAISEFLTGTVPVLVEPLRKMLLPVIQIVNPNASLLTRLYLILAMLWSFATWAFFGGIITRIAAVQFAGKERIDLKQAVLYVARRYTYYLLSPLVPLGVIAVIVICMALYGLVGMIPILGDVVLYGIGMPLVILGGIAIAVLLVGLIGYPLMYTTISAEGSDTFDALSRSYNYVFQAIWSYLWYSLVAIVYGAVVTLFVVFMGSLMVYMGKWAVCQAPGSESSGRKPDFLFIHSPESFGWKELLLKGSPIEKKAEPVLDKSTGRSHIEYKDANAEIAQKYMNEMEPWNHLGAWMTTFWMVLVFMLVIGFSYSYFWTASTMIYLLMRKKVDETELDEVFVEEELPPAPPVPPVSPAPAPVPAPAGGVSLPTVPPSPPAVPPTVPPSPAT